MNLKEYVAFATNIDWSKYAIVSLFGLELQHTSKESFVNELLNVVIIGSEINTHELPFIVVKRNKKYTLLYRGISNNLHVYEVLYKSKTKWKKDKYGRKYVSRELENNKLKYFEDTINWKKIK